MENLIDSNVLISSNKEILKDCKDCEIQCFSLNNKEFDAKITSVYDADTCKAVFYLNGELIKYTLRLVGIDTPEIRPKKSSDNREEEIIAAKRARNRFIQLCTNCELEIDKDISKKELQKIIDKNTKIIKLKCFEFDKYGRLLANILIIGEFSETINVNEVLIKEGHGYNYDGGTKKKFTKK